MFGLFSSRKPLLHGHWYALIPDFQISTSEFYAGVEEELAERQVPNLEIARVPFFEGGVLSDRREYLKMRRERLLFEICSAPFGTSWFFSCRFSEIPLIVRIWEYALILAGLAGIFGLYSSVFGTLWGSIIFGVSVVGLIYLLHNVVSMGLYDFDARLCRVPVIGPFYEKFLRRNTYYREDTRLMYCDLVDAVVRSKVTEFTDAQEITQVEFKRDESPLSMNFAQIAGQMLGGLCRGIWNIGTK